MTTGVLPDREGWADGGAALDRAMASLLRKLDVAEDEIAEAIYSRDRTAWSRFRYELAREIGHRLRACHPQVRRVYLWEGDDGDPEDTEAPAEPALDLIVLADAAPDGIEATAAGLGRGLADACAARLRGTPLAVRVHTLTPDVVSNGTGVAAVFGGIHQRPLLVVGEDGEQPGALPAPPG